MHLRTRIVLVATAATLLACGPHCTPSETQCSDAGNSYCADTTLDLANCGSCGAACGPGLTCVNGGCNLVCADDLPTCAGVGDGGPYCADLQTDSLNCGACGSPCPGGQTCAAGSCALSCSPGDLVCADSNGNPACTDPTTDALNCGTCGTICGPHVPCVDGVCGGSCSGCVPGCPPGETFCEEEGTNSFCTDTQSDSFSCGGCGIACPTDQACYDGSCMCGPGIATCTDSNGATFCANLILDPQNCGACGEVCPPGNYCNNACVALTLVSISRPAVSGMVVTLTGNGLDPSATVLFDRTPATVIGGDDLQLQVVVPAGVGGAVAVTAALHGALSNPLVTEVWGTTAPTKANPGFAGCTTATSNAGRKIATDSIGTIYVAFQCGAADAGPDLVSVSTDYGQTFHESQLPLTGYLELALEGGAAGTVFAAAFTPDLTLAYLYSTDFGETWSTPVVLDPSLAGPPVVSMAYLNGQLQIAVQEAAGIVLYTSNAPTRGSPFAGSSSAQLAVQWFDVLLGTEGSYVAGDSSNFTIQRENGAALDGGIDSPGPGQAFDSDWALGATDAGAVIYVAGLAGFPLAVPAAAYAISTSNLTATQAYTSTELVDRAQAVAVTTDVFGNGYLVAETDGGIGLQQLPLGGTAASAPLSIAGVGSWPVIAPGLGQSVIVGYTDADGGIAVSIQTFP